MAIGLNGPFENQDDVDKLILAAKSAGYFAYVSGVNTTELHGRRASSFSFEPLPTPSLPSVAEVIGKQILIDINKASNQSTIDILKEGITDAIALHEQRQAEAQRRSFAFGNASIDNPNVTREAIDKAADAATRPDIGQEIAKEYLVDDNEPFIANGVRYSKSDIENILASLINQGVARGAMEQWKLSGEIVMKYEFRGPRSLIMEIIRSEPR